MNVSLFSRLKMIRFLVVSSAGLLLHSGEAFAGQWVGTALANFSILSGPSSPRTSVVIDKHGNIFGTTASGGDYNNGVIYEVVKGSHTVTTIASFKANEGIIASNLLMDADGNLFGLTTRGGANDKGMVFEVAAGSSTITTLDSFNGTNGSIPNDNMTFDKDGNLFGTTFGGGPGNLGTVFEIAKGTNTIKTYASFSNSIGTSIVGGVTFDSHGNMYAIGEFGGTSSQGRILKVAKGSNQITAGASFNLPGGTYADGELAIDPDGNLWGKTRQGGLFGFGQIFEYNPVTDIITSVASFTRATGFYPEGSLIFDAAGNLFGTTTAGGSFDAGTTFEIMKGTNTITPIFSMGRTIGGAPFATLTIDAAGNIYGSATQNGSLSGGTVFELIYVPEPLGVERIVSSLVAMGCAGWMKRKRKSVGR